MPAKQIKATSATCPSKCNVGQHDTSRRPTNMRQQDIQHGPQGMFTTSWATRAKGSHDLCLPKELEPAATSHSRQPCKTLRIVLQQVHLFLVQKIRQLRLAAPLCEHRSQAPWLWPALAQNHWTPDSENLETDLTPQWNLQTKLKSLTAWRGMTS